MAAKVFEILLVQQGKFGVQIKIVRKSETQINDVFGSRVRKESETYYKWVGGEVNSELAVGGTVTLDPDDYIIRKKDFVLPDTGEIVELSYLYDKSVVEVE